MFCIYLVATWPHTFIKIHRTVFLKQVNFTVCELHLSKLGLKN